MDERRMKGLMGLCVRAGQAVFGEDGCHREIEKRRCGILLADGDISSNSRKRYEELCGRTGTRMVILRPGLLLEATGKPGAAMAVKQGSFSEQMISCL